MFVYVFDARKLSLYISRCFASRCANSILFPCIFAINNEVQLTTITLFGMSLSRVTVSTHFIFDSHSYGLCEKLVEGRTTAASYSHFWLAVKSLFRWHDYFLAQEWLNYQWANMFMCLYLHENAVFQPICYIHYLDWKIVRCLIIISHSSCSRVMALAQE